MKSTTPRILSFLPEAPSPDNDSLLEAFLRYTEAVGIALYPAQENAILELFEGRNVILNTPTGSGKSLVATALHFQSFAQKRRSVYTCPIKALVNEKWLALCRDFGPENVGLSTGDATVNRDAPILCCTAEILANIALREGNQAAVHDVVMDEFHYYGDSERGVAWQVPLLTLPQTRFLLMSATLGDTDFFERELTQLNGRNSVTIKSGHRPVPLDFSYSEVPLANTVESLLHEHKAPVYVVHFTQLEAAQSAQDFMSLNVCSKEEKTRLSEALEGFRFSSPYGPDLKKWLRHGIGLHHAGLLPKYRILVEKLAQQGLLKIICGTDTLGVGINVPIRTVLLTQLFKFSGKKTAVLSARDFHQITGRAGRKGFDDVGWVVAQAPAHVIENLQLEQKQATSGKKFVKRKPPEKNFVAWDKQTLARLIAAPPERLQSHFRVTHGMLLNVLSRKSDGARAMRQLIQRSHESARSKRQHTKRAWQLFRALLEPRIIEIIPPSPEGTRLRVNMELQEDFSMNHTLSLYLHETLGLLDPHAPDYALKVLSLVESILEDPDFILRRQLDKVKGEALAEMKARGVEYEARLEELEKLEHPKPERDFIYATFNAFSKQHPWVEQENIRPKSIAREMFEEYRSFSDYIQIYQLHRVEGLLLRHLSAVHKVLAQSVPDTAKNEALQEMENYLQTLLRQVDSSLLDQWQHMLNPDSPSDRSATESRPPAAPLQATQTLDPAHRPGPFLARARDHVFRFLRALSHRDFATALEQLHDAQGTPAPAWSPSTLESAMQPFFAERGRIRLDPEARNAQNTRLFLDEASGQWRIQQTLVDPEGLNDWSAEFAAHVEALQSGSDRALSLVRIGSLI
ncbi:MAG: hypothetical protein RLZZ142_2771 [Verrucomicrobiota bacterium]